MMITQLFTLAFVFLTSIQHDSHYGTITGTVYDSATGKGLAGAYVSIQPLSPTRQTTSDEDGKFTFTEIPVGKYVVVAVKKPFAATAVTLNVWSDTVSSVWIPMRLPRSSDAIEDDSDPKYKMKFVVPDPNVDPHMPKYNPETKSGTPADTVYRKNLKKKRK